MKIFITLSARCSIGARLTVADTGVASIIDGVQPESVHASHTIGCRVTALAATEAVGAAVVSFVKELSVSTGSFVLGAVTGLWVEPSHWGLASLALLGGVDTAIAVVVTGGTSVVGSVVEFLIGTVDLGLGAVSSGWVEPVVGISTSGTVVG